MILNLNSKMFQRLFVTFVGPRCYIAYKVDTFCSTYHFFIVVFYSCFQVTVHVIATQATTSMFCYEHFPF